MVMQHASSLNQLVVLVTGSSRGIGRAIAAECARKGAIVAVHYSSARQEADQVVRQIERDGGRACAFQADIGVVAEIERLFDQVIARFGQLDILINNAGVMINRPIEQVSEEDFDRVFRVNVKGLFFCCQQAARKMKAGGRIINIGSSVTRVMLPTYGSYAASKGAVEQITRVLARELGGRNITVNTVSPGPTDTELFRHGKTPEQIEKMAAQSPFNRLGTPEDIARVVALICESEAAWVSGQTILVNGAFVG